MKNWLYREVPEGLEPANWYVHMGNNCSYIISNS